MYRYEKEELRENINNTCKWIKEFVRSVGAKKVVIGISGGKDSTVAAMLCVKALGDENVIGVLLPNGTQKDMKDSVEVCNRLDIKYIVFDINEEYQSDVRDYENLRKVFGLEFNPEVLVNVAPRIRMKKIYEVAAAFGGVVCGTGNYCERTVGYTTKHGDNACDFNPLGNCMVSLVVAMGLELADEFKMRKKLILKTPSDGLGDKTDEEKLGVTYEQIETYMVQPDLLAKKDRDAYFRIKSLEERNMHKQEPTPVFKPTCCTYMTTDGR